LLIERGEAIGISTTSLRAGDNAASRSNALDLGFNRVATIS
jgi:hypothetical protein